MVTQTIRSGLNAGKENPRHPMKAEKTMPMFTGGRLQLRRMSDIVTEKIDWLWKGVLARGHITLIAGDPGTGKSQVSLSLAAIVSNGGKWPVTGDAVEPGNVIILSREDRAEDTIKPRLLAAGADENRVFIVGDVDDGDSGRDFRLKADMPLLKAACEELGQVSLIIIDPVSSYMADGDINNAGDVRAITNELAGLVHDYKAAVLMITHNSKGQGSAGNKVTGSHAWLASARTAFSVTKDDESDVRTMAPIKANITKDTDAYRFTVQETAVANGIGTSFVSWQDASVSMTADQVLADKQDGPMVSIAKNFLIETVRYRQRVPSMEVNRMAKELGIATKTLARAKSALSITSVWDRASSQYVYVWPTSGALEQTIAPFDPVF